MPIAQTTHRNADARFALTDDMLTQAANPVAHLRSSLCPSSPLFLSQSFCSRSLVEGM